MRSEFNRESDLQQRKEEYAEEMILKAVSKVTAAGIEVPKLVSELSEERRRELESLVRDFLELVHELDTKLRSLKASDAPGLIDRITR